ncbi:M3 family metallopeptidase [Pseudoalteromonas sp. YIC-656]|uniref:M3 family metallopeptidase n=1 Tax=Pseudoalteromonas pernae TaxID=3118054 RepID=UPI003242F380
MRLSVIAAAIAATTLLSACSEQPATNSQEQKPTAAQSAPAKEVAQENLFLRPSPLQYMAPEFDKITMDMYEPAFAAGIEEQKIEIDALAKNPGRPSFENTLVAMEESGEILKRVRAAFNNLSGLISNEEYQRIEAKMAPIMAEHRDNIYLNKDLFDRVAAIYKEKDKLSKEDQRLTEYYYKQFVRAGANLDADQKQRMREINAELSKLSTQFSQNVLKSFKEDTILVTDEAQLAGLGADEIASLKAAAEKAGKEGYLITLVNTTRQPILSSLENRELREKVWRASAMRAQQTNGPIAIKEAQLRAEKAQLLGFESWAHYQLDDRMAKTPGAVFTMLDDLAPKAVAKAKKEAEMIQAAIEKDGKDFELQPWDWAYYGAKVRAEMFDIDASLVKPYFEMNTVINDGLFFAMNKLYGITMKERNDIPTYHEDVFVWEVFNEDSSSVGLFYLDPYAREGKRGGAWMSSYVGQNHLEGTKPVIYNAQNIPKPAEGQLTLMTFSEVTTMFHEFGHAIHGLFSDVKYPSLAGTATARDFVEFPSQANEDWNIEPSVLANYAKHYQTGEPIPQELLEKLLKSHTFNQGFDTTEYLAAALLDMEWHSIAPGTQIEDVAQFEKAALERHGIDYYPVPPRYKTCYFSHIFAGGYSAGYYAYLWTEVFAADAFAHMQNEGGLTRKNGDHYRKEVLSRGNSRDLMQSYVEFRGQQPTTDALLKRRGLVDGDDK